MRWLFTAFVWVVAITAGVYGSKYYRQWMSDYRAGIVKAHADAWDDAIGKDPNALGTAPAPNSNDVVSHELLGQQHMALRTQLSKVDHDKVAAYYKKQWKIALKDVAKPRPDPDPLAALALSEAQGDIGQTLKDIDKSQQDEYASALAGLFKKEWEIAYRSFDDTPVPTEFAAQHILNKRILDESGEVKAQLERRDNELYRSHPRRIGLAIDSFSGYCIFRSPEFRDNLNKKLPPEKRITLHLVDDKAVYKTRIQTLKKGNEEGGPPLAVFTIDALINNSALFDKPPGKIVLLLDETHGADAIIGNREMFPDTKSMNRKDLKIIGVGDSPSETLARVARTKLQLNQVHNDSYLRFDTPEDVVKQFKAADPKDPKVFALWEPYISQLVNNKDYPNTIRLTSSKEFPGYIVDVLVAEENYLKDHRAEVAAIVEAYLETLPSQQKDSQGNQPKMVDLVQQDAERLKAKLTATDAATIVEGIYWKTAKENYGHFGLLPDVKPDDYQSVLDMIKNSKTVLIQAGALDEAKALSDGMKAEDFIDTTFCKSLLANNFKAKDLDWVRNDSDAKPWIIGSGGSIKVMPITKSDFKPILFTSGDVDFAEDDKATEVLNKAVETLKDHRDYYLEIQGHPAGNTPEDVTVAQARADFVLAWLKKQDGIDASHLRAVTIDATKSEEKDKTGIPKKVVTLKLLQPAH